MKNPFNLPLSDVDNVFQCVCCHLSWTKRKTAAQKLNHMQTCAKKYSYDEETVRILLERAVKSASTSATKSQSKLESSGTPKTYLEELVHDKPAKKKKYQNSETLVRNVNENRSAILARAGDIFSSKAPDESIALDHPPVTQNFAASSLGSIRGLNGKGLQVHDVEMPLTQAFSGSRFAQRSGKTLFNFEGDGDNTSSSAKSRSPSPFTSKFVV